MGDTGHLSLGFLYPGFAAEDDYPRLAGMLSSPASVEVVHTSLGAMGDTHTVESLRAMGEGERLAAGAAELARRGVGCAVWACTSGSFVYGWEGAHRQVADLERTAGVPASSASLAFVHAAAELGVRRVAVAATYPVDVAACFAKFLAAAGIAVVGVDAAGVMTATEAGYLGPDRVTDMVLTADRPHAEAVLVPDTALHTVALLPRLEAAIGKPVLTANQVSVWEALRLIGGAGDAAAGRLFERRHAATPSATGACSAAGDT